MRSSNSTQHTPNQALVELERSLAEVEMELEEKQRERDEIQGRLQALRDAYNHCPRCGRDRDFLTDEGGYLAHVLEDPNDTELLDPGKPLYCPDCGEVFLYSRLPVKTPVVDDLRAPKSRLRRIRVAAHRDP